MRSILLAFLCLLLVEASLLGQVRIKNYVLNNAIKVNSLAISDTNYADLRAIGEAIGNARFVMLGEQDHGDAPTFIAKARLIKYLHEQLGFDVLAFESDFFGLTGGYDEMRRTSGDLDNLLSGNLFPIWTLCVQFQDTWRYLRECAKTNKPLHVAGIDNQFHGAYTADKLPKLIERLITTDSASTFIKQLDRARYFSLLNSIIIYNTPTAWPKQSDLAWLAQQTEVLIQQLKTRAEMDSFTLMSLENIRSTCRHIQLSKERENYNSIFEERDVQMAKNLQWLAQIKYPSEKIIVWAANGHISKNHFETEPRDFRHQSLGAYFTKDLGYADQTYVLGFNSFEGSTGRTTVNNGRYQVPEKNDKSLERWISRKDREFAFIDFKTFNRKFPGISKFFTMSASDHAQQKGAWQKAFDGIFFIQKMYPCDKTE